MSSEVRKTYEEAIAFLEPRAGGRLPALGRLNQALATGAVTAITVMPIRLRGFPRRPGNPIRAEMFCPIDAPPLLNAPTTWRRAGFTVAREDLERVDRRPVEIDDSYPQLVSTSASWPLVGALAWIALRSLEGVAGILDPLVWPVDRRQSRLHDAQHRRRKAASLGTLCRDIAENYCKCASSTDKVPVTWLTCHCLLQHLAELQTVGLRELGSFAACSAGISRPLAQHELAEVRVGDDRLSITLSHGVDEIYVETGFLKSHWPAKRDLGIAKASAVSRCNAWLKEELGGDRRNRVKDDYRTEALERFPGLTANAFNDVWRTVARMHGADRPGRPKNPRKKNPSTI